MNASEKSHQILSNYKQFIFKKRFEVNKRQIFASEKMINSGNYIYDYAHSFFVEDFQFNALYWRPNVIESCST